MYNKNKSIIKVSTLEIGNFMEGTDIFNSKFIYLFRKLDVDRTYKVNIRDFRLDLLSESIFQRSNYGELILLFNGLTISELKSDLLINVFKLEDLVNLVSKLSTVISPRDYLKTLKS